MLRWSAPESTRARHPIRRAAPERSLLGTMAGHVTDDDADRSVGQLDRIDEVAAEERLIGRRRVLRGPAEIAGAELRRGQQAASQPTVLVAA